jgi:probable HAF family extracellular repeat protein
MAINSSGVVVGGSYYPASDFGYYPIIWTAAGGLQPLFGNNSTDELKGGEAYGINDNGMVVGYMGTAALIGQAFYTTEADGVYAEHALPYLGTGTESAAYGVNNSGQVVGFSTFDSTGAEHAFTWNSTTGMQDLNSTALVPGLGGWTLTDAYAINTAGQIVGDGSVTIGGTLDAKRAFLLTPAISGDANLDGRVDVNDLTIVLAHFGQSGMTWTEGEFTGSGTVDVNDLTIVLANYGKSQNIGSSAGPPTAVPEPASLGLLAAAMAAAALLLRRRRG